MPPRRKPTKSKGGTAKEVAKSLIESLGPETPKGAVPETPTIDSHFGSDTEEEEDDVGPFTPLQRYDTEEEDEEDIIPVTPGDSGYNVKSPVIDYKSLNKIHSDDPIHTKLYDVGCAICCFITDKDLENSLYVLCIDHKGRKIIVEIDEKEYASLRSHDIVSVSEKEEYSGSHAIISAVRSKLSLSIYGAAVISDNEYHFMRFSDTGDIHENTYEVQKGRNKYFVPKIYPIVRLSDLLADPEHMTVKIKEAYMEFHHVQYENDKKRKKEVVEAVNATGQAVKEFSSRSNALNELIGDEWMRLRTLSIKYERLLNGELTEEERDSFDVNRFGLSLMFQYYTRIFELHDSLRFDTDKLREIELDIQKKLTEIDELKVKIQKRVAEEGELDLKL